MNTFELYTFKFKINIIFKILIYVIILFSQLKFEKITKINNYKIAKNYLEIYKDLKLSFFNNITNKIRIGIYSYYLKNGGRARITSILINFFFKYKIFNIFLLTNKNKENDEYIIQKNIKRINIKNIEIKYLIKMINKKKLDILIYPYSYSEQINILNNLKNTKIIFYIHQSIFFWIYSNLTYIKSLYKSYKQSRYIISLINFENYYIFKKWGLNTILMNSLITYEYNSVLESDLSSETILMIGRADNKYKRFEIGIQSMEYIIQYIPNCIMKVISNISNIDNLKFLVNSLELENNVKFNGYISTPDILFKNVSLNILTSISESFSLVLCETKIYGIPNIIIGLDYISIAYNGTVIIYDDRPETISKESLIILKNYVYKKRIGKKARNSMKQINNKFLFNKWIKLILLIYFETNNYNFVKYFNSDKKITNKEAINILLNQLKLLKYRNFLLNNNNNYDIENISFIENLIN